MKHCDFELEGSFKTDEIHPRQRQIQSEEGKSGERDLTLPVKGT